MFRKKNGQEFMDETNLDSSTNDKEEKKGFFHRKKKKEINLYEDDMGYIEDDSNFDEDEYDKELEELQEEEKPEKKRGFFHRKKKEEEKSFILFAGSFAVLALQGIFLMFTGNLPIVFWLPCMMGAILIMFIYLLFGAELSAWEGVYCTAKAFLLAEFAASLEW